MYVFVLVSYHVKRNKTINRIAIIINIFIGFVRTISLIICSIFLVLIALMLLFVVLGRNSSFSSVLFPKLALWLLPLSFCFFVL
jgi:hypothetical protein